MFFQDPSKNLSEVFHARFLKFVTTGSFPLTNPDEIIFYLDDLNLNLSVPSTVFRPTSKYIVAVKPAGFNFYLIDEVKEGCFIGSKLNTHIHYILDATSIAYLRGYLYSIYQKEQAHV